MRISDWSSDVCSSDLFTCAGNSLLVFGRQFVHTQNGDDVAQFFVALQSLLHAASHCIVLFTHDLWIELAAGGVERIDGGINTQGGDITRQHDGGVQVLEGRCGRRVGQVIGRDVNGRSEEHTSELQSLMRTSYAV